MSIIATIRCPFYKGHDNSEHRIVCEGLGEARRMCWEFGCDKQQYRRQLQLYCKGDYTHCELCLALSEYKYGGG